MLPHKQFSTYHGNLKPIHTLEERIIAQTFRQPPQTQNQFKYEKTVIQNLRQSNQLDLHQDKMSTFMIRLVDVQNSLLLFYLFLDLSPQKTVIRELTTLIYRQREMYISYDEFHILLSKLRVCEEPELSLQWFRTLDNDGDNLINLGEFQQFVGQEITNVNLLEMIEPEYILRIGLEIFANLSEDNPELDLKKAMNFIKFRLKENFDFLETIEMFGFVQDLYFGQVRTKVTLLSFFQTVSPYLRKCLSKVLLRKCYQILQDSMKPSVSFQPSRRQGLHSRNTNSEQLILPNPPSRISSPFNTQHNHTDSIKSDIEKLLQKNFQQLNLEVEVQDEINPNKSNDQEEIANYLRENRPKQRGWLQKLSLTKQNKWSLLYFQIDQHTKQLRAVKPDGVKKIIEVSKCEFEIIVKKEDPVDLQKKSHRKSNSLTQQQAKQVQGKPMLTEQRDQQEYDQNQFNQVSYVLAQTEYLLITEVKQKSMILQSFDCREILSIVKEIRQRQQKGKKLEIFQEEQLTFSGIVNLGFSGEKSQSKLIASLNKMQFKESLMVIKECRIFFYNVVPKHILQLEYLSIGPGQSNLPFVPSHPFSFQVIYNEQSQAQVDYLQLNQVVEQDQGSVIMWQIDEDEEESENESIQKKQQKKGLFDSLMDKLKSKKESNQVKIIFAAESELKRRQWIFSINYYRTSQKRELMELNTYKSNKSSIVQQSQLNYQSLQQFHTPINSQQNQQFPIRSQLRSQQINNSFNNRIFIGGNHTHINMNLFTVNNGDEDYYDVFKDQQVGQANESNNNQIEHFEGYCHTDPNEKKGEGRYQICTILSQQQQNKKKDQSLFQVGQKTIIKNHMITGTTNFELWQRFLLSFFRFLAINKKQIPTRQNLHIPDDLTLEESQEPSIQRLYNCSLNVQKPK